MIILTSPSEMHEWAHATRNGRSVGFVPTMGALHTGHEVLLQQSKHENDLTVLSIFVNPTQFNVQSDFDAYPRNDQRDLQIAEHHGVDVVYLPKAETMYPEGWRIYVEPGTAADPLEGLGRPGHFRGVATVVTKLFNTVQPHRAYFGKKDYQQLAVIRQMVSELNFDISVVGVNTVRHDDGLAMSSRNVRLTPEHRLAAPIIHQSLRSAESLVASGETSAIAVQNHVVSALNSTPECRIEYVEVVRTEDLTPVSEINSPTVICVAVWFGDVRLIDNIEIASLIQR
jgi:pantoate--beta-alanine ligase